MVAFMVCNPGIQQAERTHVSRDIGELTRRTPQGRARQGNYTSTICAHIADNQFAGLETRRMAARFAGLNWPDAKSNTLHGLSNPRQYWADRGRSQYSFSGEDDLA